MNSNAAEALIVNSEENRKLIEREDSCDKYDYLTAVACGAIGGVIDIFLVGAPNDSVLTAWTDAQVDNAVMAFSRRCGWSPRAGKENSVASAIGFLERKFQVNYDQKNRTEVNNLFNMASKNHHMMSLAHSPDLIGLFFSVLNQFTSTSTFIANGKIITIDTKTFELQGTNFISKIFCGIANWFGHIMSDIAGSSGSRGNAGRGTGIVIPFYELLGLCKFGKFNVGKDKQDLATIATRAFQEGYDFRFGLAAAIPVVITDLSIRLIWSLRQYFQYEKPMNECIPTQKHADLRVMLLFGNATLCVMDGIDATTRSGGNFLMFFMRLNLIAWYRLTMLALKELCIRLGISADLSICIESYRQINRVLIAYLNELERIDIKRFQKETEDYNRLTELLEKDTNNDELNMKLLEIFDSMGFQKPWQGDFDEHMSNKNATLIFR